MEHPVIIRIATSDDLPILLEFEQGVIAAERPFNPTLKKKNATYYDIGHMIISDYIHLIVAIINDEIVGSGYARIEQSQSCFKHKKFGYLGFMYVLPEHRGKGINGKILKTIMEWCSSQDINEIRLDVYSDNISAIKAYEKVGFTKLLTHMRMEVRDI